MTILPFFQKIGFSRGFTATLRRILILALYAPPLLRQQLDTGPKFSPSWLHNKRPPGEVSMAKGGGDVEQGEQEGLTPKEPGMSDLIRSEYARG